MVRTLLSWRWAASTVVLVAAVITMAVLGTWQWERSVPTAEREVVDLEQVDPASLPEVTTVSRAPGEGALVPDEASGDLVRVEGTWRPERTLLVADRELDAAAGAWVMTAVELADGTGLAPVVRGWVPDGTAGTDVAPVSGPVVLLGWVQQSEPLDIPVDVVQPEGVVGLLSTADLANRWPEQLVPGFVVLASAPEGTGAEGTGADGVVPALLPAPPEEQTQTRDWRNLAYSAQWFVFAAFAVLLWWRMLRDDVTRQAAVAGAAAAEPDPPEDPWSPEEPLPRQRPTERSTT
ncbi:SURF1 family protein [Aquipuribacter sp. MA13-6]|uniref:SURF1 family protein n=1 Tax=unclassified Aquipuribacter TaxID=2635084 RepID=UPI003EF01F16